VLRPNAPRGAPISGAIRAKKKKGLADLGRKRRCRHADPHIVWPLGPSRNRTWEATSDIQSGRGQGYKAVYDNALSVLPEPGSGAGHPAFLGLFEDSGAEPLLTGRQMGRGQFGGLAADAEFSWAAGGQTDG